MADIPQSREVLRKALADNLTGDITAQTFRDALVTVMPAEFLWPEDWSKGPEAMHCHDDPATGRGWRGWIDYSQLIESTVNFGDALFVTPSGTWRKAQLSESHATPVLGLALGEYIGCTAATVASVYSIIVYGESQALILRKGIIYDETWDGRFILLSGLGRQVFLQSEYGQWSVTLPSVDGGINKEYVDSLIILGVVEQATRLVWPEGISATAGAGRWRFDPEWKIIGN